MITILDGVRGNVVLTIVVQLILLAFYIRGIRHHGHGSFLLLSIAAVLLIISTALMTVSYFIDVGETTATAFFQWGLLASYPALGVALWGCISMIRACLKHVPRPEPPASTSKWNHP